MKVAMAGAALVCWIAACSPGSAEGTASPSPSPARTTPSPVAVQSPQIPPTASGYLIATDAGIGGIEAKTGLTYVDGNCPGTAPCLGVPKTFGDATPGGHDAAYVTMPTGSATCYAYVFFEAGAWHYTTPVVCPASAGSNPVLGGQTRVFSSGPGCVNVRSAPGLAAAIVACFADGRVVSIDPDFPRYVDRHIWWSVNGHQGWMAHDFLISNSI